ncbi:uncharacterized protein LOC144445204 [Glandiceps talaboti]
MSLLHELTTDGDAVGLETALQTTGLSIDDTDAACCGKTPLHWACYLGRLECVHVLLRYGANVMSCMSDGKLPAHCAAETGQLECLQVLLDTGCSVRVTDNFNDSPRRIAEIYGRKECIELLQRAEDKELEMEMADHGDTAECNQTQCVVGDNNCPEIKQEPIAISMTTAKRRRSSRS